MSSDYFIGVNAAEIDRLQAQHDTWRPETDALWRDAGFGSCASILDIGCGPGFTSFDLARLAGPHATVTALDKASTYLEYLSAQARAQGIGNVKTMSGDIAQAGSIPGTFDAAFTRWCLAFLRDDMDAALQTVRGALRPGGTFAAMEYLTLRSLTCSPSSAAFDAHTRAWIEFYRRNGGDSSVGASLPQQLTAAGFTIRSLKCVGGMADPTHRWWAWWGRLIRDFSPIFVEQGLMRSDEWDALRDDWARMSQQRDAFIYTPILLQVIAERPA